MTAYAVNYTLLSSLNVNLASIGVAVRGTPSRAPNWALV